MLSGYSIYATEGKERNYFHADIIYIFNKYTWHFVRCHAVSFMAV
jgi:hypothetical protein